MATFQPICANQAPNNAKCNNTSRFACKNYLLVTYCGPECQKSHWTMHKSDCKSHLGREGWQPDWVLENRAPAFIGNGHPQVTYGAGKYLWGNVPAFDVLQLNANEGVSYDEQVRLLFAASGDLRNVIKTIAQLPDSYTQPVEVTINDRNLDIVARNVIMLLISLVVDDVDIAADCIIHVWYSALLRKSDLDIMQHRIRPVLEEVCHKLKGKGSDNLQAKNWTFGQRSLRLVLKKSVWDDLLSFTGTPKGLTANRAHEIRKAVTLAEGRKDYRERHLLVQSLSHRIALTRFREDGLLLPFGNARDAFRHPNPTIYQDASWPMYDNADPLNGWSAKEVQETQTGPATADIYGKLLISLRTVLLAFLRRLSSSQISFRLFHMDASTLPKLLENSSFNRIEVSNIPDAGYLGIHRTLDLMVPLLQSPLINPHATLITLFMNTVDENITETEKLAEIKADGTVTKRIYEYLSLSRRPLTYYDTTIFKIMAARDYILTYNHLVGAMIKENHTVIEKWPFRLKLRPGQTSAQEEFNRLLGGGVSSKERYVEWKRVEVLG
ncbi:hypothetical protein BDP81DRAFT_437802 [Colletotrichum phormii]|uniref:Suppressor of anucleate metulae protein B n=1 Tax=Colletotrichum phormii TaxID=359342 RepID=A0AAJ0ECE5_9PEZI|nr:uncharacterized protein BDP81DRAFT_437802 [Colletotrichum phormii]KAK1624557.1 hypothetical protein BDP81DRAFT_437802 [Colletotrichum phormii]